MVNLKITDQALAFIKKRGNSVIIRSVRVGANCCAGFENPVVSVGEPPENEKYEKFIHDGVKVNISQSIINKCPESLTISVEGFLFLKELKVSGISVI